MSRYDVQRVSIERTTGRKIWEAIIFKGGALVLALALLHALLTAVL